MKTRLIEEQPLYIYKTCNANPIVLYRKDFDKLKIGSEFYVEDWEPDVNAKIDEYTTVKCIYKDANGVLLRERTITSYRNSLDEDDIEIALVWVELKTEEQK